MLNNVAIYVIRNMRVALVSGPTRNIWKHSGNTQRNKIGLTAVEVRNVLIV